MPPAGTASLPRTLVDLRPTWTRMRSRERATRPGGAVPHHAEARRGSAEAPAERPGRGEVAAHHQRRHTPDPEQAREGLPSSPPCGPPAAPTNEPKDRGGLR